MNYGELLFFGLLVAAVNVLGGILLTRTGAQARSPRTIKYLVALGAGFMLAAIFIEVVPAAVALWAERGGRGGEGVTMACALLLTGYLLIHFFEHTVAPHFHFGAET